MDGLKIEQQLQTVIALEEAKKFLAHKDVQGGMKPKLSCAISALESGVDHVHIINGGISHAVLLELFTDQGIGSMISRSES